MNNKAKKILSVTAAALSVFNVLYFYAIHFMWSGIIAILGSASPYIIMGIIAVLAALSVITVLCGKHGAVRSIITLVLSAFFLAVEIYITWVTRDSLPYFFRTFARGLLIMLAVGAVVFLLFYYPRTKLANVKWLKCVITAALLLALIIPYFNFLPNTFTCDPVVYAVGDDFQIVFTTRDKGTAWVEIGGEEYNDTYAGYRTSEDKVHKITVPQEALDNAGSYTINSRAMFLRGPYSAFQGSVISREYNWKGVDTSDGINYYVVSDTHLTVNAPASAAGYFGDKLDFLVCAGDTANWIDEQGDIMYFLKLAGKVTNSEIPVVYARGNHETKGLMADELYKYVASVNQEFYYTFRLQNIWGIVLDQGEDHGDDWSEFYGASRFDEYREKQVAFLDSVIENKENEYSADGVDYRIAVCHMPVSFMYRSDHAEEYKDMWIDRLNQMNITVMLGGHRHQLMYIPAELEDGTPLTYYKDYAGYDGSKPDGYATHANFPSVLVSRRSSVQPTAYDDEMVGDTLFYGLAVSADSEKTVMRFTNQDGEVLENIMSPWLEGVSYGSEIEIPNK